AGGSDLTIETQDHRKLRMHVEIVAGRNCDAGIVRLESGIELAGVVQNEATRRPTGCVYCFAVTDFDKLSEFEPAGSAQVRDGVFRIRGLPRGIYIVGALDRIPQMFPSDVSRGAVPGWLYVDARGGSVSGLV